MWLWSATAKGFSWQLCRLCLAVTPQAQSLDQLMERVQEAIALYLEVEGDSTNELDFVGVQRVCVEA